MRGDMDPSIAMLAERMVCLEREALSLKRQVRRWKRGGLLIGVAGAIGLMIGAAKQADVAEVIRARTFALVDNDGKPRAALFVAEDGDANLSFYDKAGGSPLGMDVTADGLPGIYLLDSRGRSRIAMETASDGRAGLVFFGGSGDERKPQIIIGLNRDDKPSIGLLNTEGKTLFHTPKP